MSIQSPSSKEHPQPRLPDVSSEDADASPASVPTFVQRLNSFFWKGGLPTLIFALILWLALIFYASMYFITPENDFGKFLYSTLAYLNGSNMYGWTIAIPNEFEGYLVLDGRDREIDLWNLNPPHFHLLFLPLAFLSDVAAFVVWMGVSLLCLRYAAKLTKAELQTDWSPRVRDIALFVALASRATTETIVNGQVSWVCVLVTALIWIGARRNRWCWAGALLGVAISMKPFFLILVPIFFFERKWWGLATTSAALLGTFGLGLLVFGMENYINWIHCIQQSDNWAWLPSNASLWGALFCRNFGSNFEFVVWQTVPQNTLKIVWLGVGGLMGLVTLLTVFLDRTPERLDRAFALLMVGAVLFSPLGWVYYFWLPVPPLVALMLVWHKEAKNKTACGWWARNWRFALLASTIPLQIVPLQVTVIGQPSAWATLTFGCIFFWAILVIWLVLIADGVGKHKWVATLANVYRRSRTTTSATRSAAALTAWSSSK